MTNRTRVWSGERISVDVVSTSTDAGGASKEVVVHPGAVAVVAVFEEDRIVLIENRRVAVGETLWEIPAGTIEPGEEPAACAMRELQEETGYRATDLSPLTTFFTTPGFCTEKMQVFVASGLKRVGQDLDPGEDIKVHLVEGRRLREMLRDGTIRDAKTMAALYLYFDIAPPTPRSRSDPPRS